MADTKRIRRNPRIQDLIGRRFGRWTVTSFAGTQDQRTWWNCVCSCGAKRAVRSKDLLNGKSRSCSCSWDGHPKHKNARRGQRSPEYVVWCGMKNRCSNASHAQWHLYGGQGIRVCHRWLQFENFLADMGQRPGPRFTIDRIDSSKDYAPRNCRWATAKEQARNMSRNRYLTCQGKTRLLCEWTESLGFKPGVILARLKRGWTVEEALTIPPRGR